MNDENLIPMPQRSESERRELARKGGKASGEARRRKASMRERLEQILDMPVRKGKMEDFKNLEDASGKNMTVQDAVLLTTVKKALKGDMRAIDFLRDTIKPTAFEEANGGGDGVNVNITIADCSKDGDEQ